MDNLDPQQEEVEVVVPEPPVMEGPEDSEALIQQHIDSVQAKDGEDEEASSEEAPPAEGEEAPVPDVEGEKGPEEPPPAEEVEKAGAEPGDEGEQKAEAFTADLSYTFRGKKIDMPEELKGVIDSPEKQEFYNDLFTKAAGLPVVMAKGKQAQESLDQITGNLDQFYQSASLKDFKKAFAIAEIPTPSLTELARGFGISKDDIIRHAYDLANQTPEQYQAENHVSDADRRVQEAEMRIQAMETRAQNQQQAQVQRGFQEVMSDPELGKIASAYDQKYGEGRFVREIALRGEQISRLDNRIEMPQVLARELVDSYNLRSLLEQPSAQAPIAGQPARKSTTKSNKSVPVIPAVESSGGSPGQRNISSLDDLSKIYQEKYGEELGI